MSDTLPNDLAFKAVLDLLAVVANPAAAKALTLDIQRQTDQLRDQQTKLSAETAANRRRDAELAARKEQLDEFEKRLKLREHALNGREAQAAESARIRSDKAPAARAEFPSGSTLTREAAA